MAFAFNGTTKVITVGAGVVAFNAQDLYEEWKDWAQVGMNAMWPQAMSTVGGESIGAGQTVSPYFFVINGWVIKPDESDHTLTVTGNLLADGGGSPFVSTTGDFNVRIITVVSSNSLTVDTGGGGSDPWATAVASGYNPGTAGDYLNRVKKYAANRVVITGTAYSVKEDDGTTEFEGGTLTPTERAPS